MNTRPFTLALTNAALFEVVVGSGCEQYSWYRQFKPNVTALRSPAHRDLAFDRPAVSVIMESGEFTASGRPLYAIASLTEAGVKNATLDLLAEEYPALMGVDWFDAEDVECSIDAEIADCIIQKAVLGRVIFG